MHLADKEGHYYMTVECTQPQENTLVLLDKCFICQMPCFIGLESCRKLKGTEIQHIKGATHSRQGGPKRVLRI